MEMLLWWENGGQFEFVSWPAPLKRERAAAFSVSITTITNEIRGSIKIPDLWLHISIFWCLFARRREKKKIIFWCCERYIPAPLSWSPGAKLTPELWLVESLLDQLWICPFVYLPLYSLPLSFVCVLSQSNRTKGRSPGVNMLQPFRFTGPAFRIIRKPRNESKL